MQPRTDNTKRPTAPEKWDVRAAFMRRLFGTESAKHWRETAQRARAQRAGMRQPARDAVDPGTPLRAEAQVVGSKEARLRVERVRAPVKTLSFGSTRCFVEVVAKQPFHAATLRFRIAEKQSKHLRRETIVAARWDEHTRRFRLIPQSGYNVERGYAYARISRAGIYTAVGLPRDVRLMTTLRLMRSLGSWPSRMEWSGFRSNICQAVLCNPD